jgi:hypothetical protein
MQVPRVLHRIQQHLLPVADRGAADLRPWANAFPYVNGGLFGIG